MTDSQRDAAYDPTGLYLGHQFRRHGEMSQEPTGEAIGITPDRLPGHTLIAGQTGGGKSVLTQQLAVSGHHVLSGTRIIIDGKGDGLPQDIARGVFATQGHLDDVIYFPCAETLPAISMFDLRPAQQRGVPRDLAVDRITDQYLTLLKRVTSWNPSDTARSEPLLRAFFEAAFDPVHGTDQFTHNELYDLVTDAYRSEAHPKVTDPTTARVFQTLGAEDTEVLEGTLSGLQSALMHFQTMSELTPMLNHSPATGEPPAIPPTEDGQPDTPLFRFEQCLDRDLTVIFDVSGFEPPQRSRITLLLLSQLWTALQRRSTHSDENLLVIDEFANLAPDELLSQYLSEARGYGLSLTAVMQFPEQIRHELTENGTTRLYDELLTEPDHVIVGPLPGEAAPTQRLADTFRNSDDIATLLGDLSKGHWLCQFTGGFGEATTQTFTMRSPRLPPGHPEGPNPLSAAQQKRFTERFAACQTRTNEWYGVDFEAETGVQEPTADASSTDDPAPRQPQTTLPTTTRFPAPIQYDTTRQGVVCETCDRPYPPTFEGIVRAIECHSSLAAINRDHLPAVDCHTPVDATEQAAAEVSDTQLRFLQAVHNALDRQYHPLEFDLTTDSMVRLREYVSVTSEEVTQLCEAGYLSRDDPFRRTLYTLTDDGRDLLGRSPRHGVDYGHGCGDLDETATHIAMVEALARYVGREYAADPDCPVTDVIRYYEPAVGQTQLDFAPSVRHALPPGAAQSTLAATSDDKTSSDDVEGEPVHRNTRLDVVGLTGTGDVYVAGEAERVNNDRGRSAPRDFDAIASQNPTEAIWVAPTRHALHKGVLTPLNDPTEGDPRIETLYSENTPTSQMSFETAGLTEVFSHSQLADRVGVEIAGSGQS